MTVLILPGWQNSGATHWQSLWEQQYGYKRVLQHDWMRPLRGDWITRLEEVMLSNKEHSVQISSQQTAQNGVFLVAHSLGCHLVAAWAALSQSKHLVRGALLVAPPDGQREEFPVELKSWRPPALQTLPFPSICVISSNDPFCELQPGRDMARAWGSRLVEIGDKGHINADSGLGDWPQGRALLQELGVAFS